MSIVVLWLLASSILILSFVADTSAFDYLLRAEVQLVVGAAVVLSFLVDPWCGLLLSLALIVMLHRIQSTSIAYVDKKNGGGGYGYGDIGELTAAIVSEDGLRNIQSNVFNPVDYDRGMVGIRGVANEGVYGAQGIVSKGSDTLPGYEA
jgi:hypothetical protein